MTFQLLILVYFFFAQIYSFSTKVKEIHRYKELKMEKLPLRWKKINDEAVKKNLKQSLKLALKGFVLISIAISGGIVLRNELGAFGEVFAFTLSIYIFLVFMRKNISETQEAIRNTMSTLIPKGEDLLKEDTRPPVLYLRSFNNDNLKNDSGKIKFLNVLTPLDPPDEVDLCRFLFTYGPVIAIGKPGEEIPPLGASRMYAGENWKEKICVLMDQSQYIIILLNNTNGLKWEISEAIRRSLINKTIFIMPPRISMDKKKNLYIQLKDEFMKSSKEITEKWPNSIHKADVLTISENGELQFHISKGGFMGMNSWFLSIRDSLESLHNQQHSE